MSNLAARTAAASAKPAAAPDGVLQRFVARVVAAYRRRVDELEAEGGSASGWREQLAGLLLADAALRYERAAGGRPPQIAVIGPTQTGKSTVVNLLLGVPAAQVSPLAGFTVHAQGFALPGTGLDEWSDGLFPGAERLRSAQLDRTRLDAFALEPVSAGTWHRAGGGLVWDTPDFDSLAAEHYRRGVLEICGLADVHVLVVSKEKYADLAVWRLLRWIEPLGRPLVVVLNKLSREAADVLPRSVAERLAGLDPRRRGTPIVPLEYRFECADAGAAVLDPAPLRTVIDAALRDAARPPGAGALLAAHWVEWTAPLRAEHAALQEWQTVVGSGLGELERAYRRDYLDHPERFDSFRRATLELLHLLELPGLGPALTQVRQVITWPVRQLVAAGRSWWQARRDPGDGPRGWVGEDAVLHDMIDALLRGLEREAARRGAGHDPRAAVWRATARLLDQTAATLRAEFISAVQGYQVQVHHEIHRTAGELYETLRQKPALLTTLRAARATTDVASVALAIKTGGAAAHDLVLAPALLALNSLLTEGALGAHMRRVAERLKARQLEHLRAALVQGVIAPALLRLSDGLPEAGRFAIAAEELAQADAALAARVGGGHD